METYENIKLLRKQLNMSQSELAKKTGYSDRSSIAKIEAGLVDLSESKITLFAKALYTTPAALMGIDESEEPDAAGPLQFFSEVQKPSDNQQRLIDLASQLPDSELSVLISAAQSLVDLHKSQDAQE